MEEIWIIPLSTLLSIVVLFLLSRLIGCRQVSELNLFDYINSITIGSLAADLTQATDETIVYYIIAMVIYSLFTYFFALFTNHSRKARLKLMGSPIVLMENGNLYKENFKRAHLDIDEFLSACRTNGYFDVSKLHTAVMEPNGKISILPKAAQQPLTPKDMRQFPSDESLSANIIVDGILQEQNLQKCGKDRAWLDNCLRANGVKNIENVFLATLDSNNVLHIFQKLDFDTSLNNIS